jgi:hypothetical protein
MLLGVEVVQRALEREKAVTVAGEHHHERSVPHEDIAVVGNIEVRRHEPGALLRLADVAHGDLPGVPVHLDLLFMPFPHGRGQDLANVRGLMCSGLAVRNSFSATNTSFT